MLQVVLQHLASHSTVCHSYLAAAARLCPLVRVDRLLGLATGSSQSLHLASSSSTAAASNGDTAAVDKAQQSQHQPVLIGYHQRRLLPLPSHTPPASQFQVFRGCKWLNETKTSIKVPTTLTSRLEQTDRVEVRMDAQVTFDACWRRFEEKFRLKDVHVPREVVWLNGAPGAGKGVNSPHIMKTRGLDVSICVSDLLMADAEIVQLINNGELIPDTMVGDVLLEALLIRACEVPECGVLVDGFPRTALQVDFLKLLHDKLHELHKLWANTAHASQFPRTLFKVVMLYVDEESSIKRQMERAQVAELHNKRVADAGAGEIREQRVTDMSVEKCKKRYEIFRQHYSAVLRLKQHFPFHLIDAMGTLDDTRDAISQELRYQSSLDLSEATYDMIKHLTLARDLGTHARAQLVMRLDQHCERHNELFRKVIDIVTGELYPMLHECGLTGRAEWVTSARFFHEQPMAVQMLIDVLTDRGFAVSHSATVEHVPYEVDLKTGQIKCRREYKHKFLIVWDVRGVRDMAKALEIAARMAEATAKNVRISQSFVPTHLQQREQHRQQRTSVGDPSYPMRMSMSDPDPLSTMRQQAVARAAAGVGAALGPGAECSLAARPSSPSSWSMGPSSAAATAGGLGGAIGGGIGGASSSTMSSDIAQQQRGQQQQAHQQEALSQLMQDCTAGVGPAWSADAAAQQHMQQHEESKSVYGS